MYWYFLIKLINLVCWLLWLFRLLSFLGLFVYFVYKLGGLLFCEFGLMISWFVEYCLLLVFCFLKLIIKLKLIGLFNKLFDLILKLVFVFGFENEELLGK